MLRNFMKQTDFLEHAPSVMGGGMLYQFYKALILIMNVHKTLKLQSRCNEHITHRYII
jgi:hypothetical protein